MRPPAPWMSDPILVSNARKARELLGDFTLEYNELQQAFIYMGVGLERRDQSEKSEAEFLRDLAIASPERYRKALEMQEAKRRAEEEVEEWLVPTSDEEAEELKAQFAEMAKDHEALLAKAKEEGVQEIDYSDFVAEMSD